MDKKINITCLPGDIINKVNLSNWEELFEDLIVNEYDYETKKVKEQHYVWKPEVMKDFIKNLVKSTTKNELRKICKDLVKIIDKSKATFFVNEKTKDIPIPPEELLHELKATIMTDVEMYFVEKLEK